MREQYTVKLPAARPPLREMPLKKVLGCKLATPIEINTICTFSPAKRWLHNDLLTPFQNNGCSTLVGLLMHDVYIIAGFCCKAVMLPATLSQKRATADLLWSACDWLSCAILFPRDLHCSLHLHPWLFGDALYVFQHLLANCAFLLECQCLEAKRATLKGCFRGYSITEDAQYASWQLS